MTTSRPLRVFLCHSSADKPAVRELYQKLRAEPWLQPWLDEEELFPGMDWNLEIEKAIEATDVILVCLSNSSITKEGYVQREIRIALDYADYKPEGTLFIIPVRLEECKPPNRLSKWQYEDYFANKQDRGFQRLLASFKKRVESLNSRPKFLSPEWISENKILLSNGMEFMLVPAGKFLMGSENDNKLSYDDEYPQHTIDIPYDYWMARYPVTNELYNAYAKAKGVRHPVDGWEKKKDHPVTYVKWTDAMAYCQWLHHTLHSEFGKQNLVLRLPTEAEWEKAARGTDLFEYPWGNQFDKNKCNTNEARKGGTTPVGLYFPLGDSSYGCSDMSGNVWEWTHSFYKPYPYKANDGREDEKESGIRVLRGGSFSYDEWGARCASRIGDHIYFFDFSLGFRVVAASPLFS